MEKYHGPSVRDDDGSWLSADQETGFNQSLTIRENIFGFEVVDVEGWLHLKNSPYIFDEVTLAERVAGVIECQMTEGESLENIWQDALATSSIVPTDSRIIHKAVLILKKHWKYGDMLFTVYSQTR